MVECSKGRDGRSYLSILSCEETRTGGSIVVHAGNCFGWDYEIATDDGGLILWTGDAPVAHLILLLAAPPLVCITCRTRRRQPTPAGHCKCGYDLRATLHRCPECGTEVR